MVGNGECHCSRTPSARENLAKCKVQIIEVPSTCDCGLAFDLHVPLGQAFQEKEVSLKKIPIEDLDCACQSAASCSSPDQPGRGSCVSTVMPMWTLDPRARQNTNEDLLYFTLTNFQCCTTSELVCCTSSDATQLMFGEIMRSIDAM